MKHYAIVVILLLGLTNRAAAQAPPAAQAAVEEIVVVGERPGPGLWKISRGGHVLWIMGTLSPLPKRLIWRSEQVESIIADCAEILGPYTVSLNVEQADPLTSKSHSLKSTLSAGDYARWLKLRARYVDSRVEDENLLPAAAALVLQSSAYSKVGLSYADELWKTIADLAFANSVSIRSLDMSGEAETSHKLFAWHSNGDGIKYLEETMDRIDADDRSVLARANAWAAGDIKTLRALTRTDEHYSMLLAHSWPYLSREEADRVLINAQDVLVRELDHAVERNEVTFAAIPINLLFQENGVLTKLRWNGLTVEDPEMLDAQKDAAAAASEAPASGQ
jgi:uncharacterized protein YbaP (TraB family)